MMAWQRVCTRDDLWTGELRGVSAGGLAVLLLDVDGEVHAYEDRCAHQQVKLSDGRLEGCELVCWAHGWRYDARTGRGVNPLGAQLRRVAVRVEGDGILVDPAVLP
jgi:toluene monooxygenase system ferredoxin subunit